MYRVYQNGSSKKKMNTWKIFTNTYRYLFTQLECFVYLNL